MVLTSNTRGWIRCLQCTPFSAHSSQPGSGSDSYPGSTERFFFFPSISASCCLGRSQRDLSSCPCHVMIHSAEGRWWCNGLLVHLEAFLKRETPQCEFCIVMVMWVTTMMMRTATSFCCWGRFCFAGWKTGATKHMATAQSPTPAAVTASQDGGPEWEGREKASFDSRQEQKYALSYIWWFYF